MKNFRYVIIILISIFLFSCDTLLENEDLKKKIDEVTEEVNEGETKVSFSCDYKTTRATAPINIREGWLYVFKFRQRKNPDWDEQFLLTKAIKLQFSNNQPTNASDITLNNGLHLFLLVLNDCPIDKNLLNADGTPKVAESIAFPRRGTLVNWDYTKPLDIFTACCIRSLDGSRKKIIFTINPYLYDIIEINYHAPRQRYKVTVNPKVCQVGGKKYTGEVCPDTCTIFSELSIVINNIANRVRPYTYFYNGNSFDEPSELYSFGGEADLDLSGDYAIPNTSIAKVFKSSDGDLKLTYIVPKLQINQIMITHRLTLKCNYQFGKYVWTGSTPSARSPDNICIKYNEPVLLYLDDKACTNYDIFGKETAVSNRFVNLVNGDVFDNGRLTGVHIPNCQPVQNWLLKNTYYNISVSRDKVVKYVFDIAGVLPDKLWSPSAITNNLGTIR